METEKDPGGPIDLDGLDYEAMEGHSDNEAHEPKVEASKTKEHSQPEKDEGNESSDDSSGKGVESDTLDKLRGRSRSGLPSPESEDISRRRDSRKDRQSKATGAQEQPPPVPVSGLSSLAKIYADDGDKEEPAAPGTEGDGPTPPKAVAAPLAAASQPKDNNHAAKVQPTADKTDKDSSARPSGRDKHSVRRLCFCPFVLFLHSTSTLRLFVSILLGAS